MIVDYKDALNKVIGKTFTVASGTKYFIAGDGKDIVHFGWIDKYHIMSTGQPQLVTYDTEKDWLDALKLLDIDPNAEDGSSDIGINEGIN